MAALRISRKGVDHHRHEIDSVLAADLCPLFNLSREFGCRIGASIGRVPRGRIVRKQRTNDSGDRVATERSGNRTFWKITYGAKAAR